MRNSSQWGRHLRKSIVCALKLLLLRHRLSVKGSTVLPYAAVHTMLLLFQQSVSICLCPGLSVFQTIYNVNQTMWLSCLTSESSFFAVGQRTVALQCLVYLVLPSLVFSHASQNFAHLAVTLTFHFLECSISSSYYTQVFKKYPSQVTSLGRSYFCFKTQVKFHFFRKT